MATNMVALRINRVSNGTTITYRKILSNISKIYIPILLIYMVHSSAVDKNLIEPS
jgi:hypothetical protein